MNSMVADSSVLIEFAKRELLPEMFELGFCVFVPDILFHDELIDLGQYHRDDLLDFGLRIESLDSTGVTISATYRSINPALSVVDSFALTLARSRGSDLMTEDRLMRRVAHEEGVYCVDILATIDKIRALDLISDARYRSTLEAMLEDPRCPVSKTEITHHRTLTYAATSQ